MIEENSKLKDNINCDVSDQVIDFSLKNNMSEMFSDFVENSMKNTCKRVARSIFMVIVGVCAGITICAMALILFIKIFGIKNAWIHNGIREYVAKLVNDEHMKVGSTEVAFGDGEFNIALKDVKIKNLYIPQLNVIPSFIKSILARRLSIQAVEICNTDIELAISNKTGNIFIKNYFEDKVDKLKYIPVIHLNRNFNIAENEIDYRLKNSNINVRKGYDNFKLNNVSGTFNGHGIIDANFYSMMGQDKITFKTKTLNNKLITTASFKNASSNNLLQHMSSNNLNILMPLMNFVSIVDNAEISGEVAFTLNNDNSLKAGSFKINANNSVISSKICKSSLNCPIRHIKQAQAIGSFDNDTLYLNNLSAQLNQVKLKATGIVLKNNNINKMDGTLEITNISKAELGMLPASISNACFALFKNNLSNFTLPTLKMDIRTTNKNHSSSPDYIIAHGKFEMRDGMLPLADKIIKNVYASGEIINDTIQLKIRSANLDNMKISGGILNIKDLGNNWNGTINTVLSSEAFIQQLNIFKKCSIPFDKFILSDNVNCELSIVSNANEKNRGFKIVSGQGTMTSGKNVLNIQWTPNNAYISGTAETKGNRTVNINISMDLKNNTGEKHLIVDSDNDVVASINEIIAATLNGKYQVEIVERWNGARGTYGIHADLNGALLTLPVFGNIKAKNQPGTILATAEIDGNIVKFNSINIDANDKHIQGTMIIDRKNNEIISCNFTDKSNRASDYMLNIKQADSNTVKMNIIGSYLDISSIWNIIRNMKKTFIVSMRIDQAKINDTRSVRHLKGRLTIRNGHIIDGAAYCTLLDGSSIVMDSTLADNNSGITNINIANAGQFFKDLNITSSVIGGKLKINIASDIREKGDISAINCELSDVLVKNNETLTKLASLSTPNNIDLKNFSIGFNGIVCSLTMKNDSVIITDGKAIGPMMCLSFSGDYKKRDDTLKLEGIAVPVNGYTAMTGQITYSPYTLVGSIFERRKSDVSVNPMVITDHNILQGFFGMKMSIGQDTFIQNTPVFQENMSNILTTPMPEIKPIANSPIEDREERYIKQPVDLDKPVKNTTPKKKVKKVSKDKDLGITITRGA